MSFDQGAFIEPASVAVRATGRAVELSGVNAVVLGAGPIGNLMAQCAHAPFREQARPTLNAVRRWLSDLPAPDADQIGDPIRPHNGGHTPITAEGSP